MAGLRHCYIFLLISLWEYLKASIDERKFFAVYQISGIKSKCFHPLQLSPMVMSMIAKNLHLNRSLLVRLHEYYSANSSSKVHLIENYRSYKEIVDIPSKLFYGSTLIARRTRPPGVGYPVHFYGVLGSEEWSKDQPSYYNMAEVAELVERVEELVHNWPEAWGEIRQSNICALAPYIAQVKYYSYTIG